MKRIRVVDYDPQWPSMYRREAARVRKVLDGTVLTVHHVGSTSVPGLAAKPVIDLLIEVKDLAAVDAQNPRMRDLGYAPRGENGIPGRRFFAKGGDFSRTYNIHIFHTGHPEIEAMLAFRDYLRSHPVEARCYGRLKKELATRHPEDIEAYISGKNPFIKERLAQARTWRLAP